LGSSAKKLRAKPLLLSEQGRWFGQTPRTCARLLFSSVLLSQLYSQLYSQSYSQSYSQLRRPLHR
jgi:hypothetical protein